nr:hypothetical protein [Tanacetum cinerariifolium]
MVGCYEVVDEVQIHVYTFGYASEELATDADCVEMQLELAAYRAGLEASNSIIVYVADHVVNDLNVPQKEKQ